jgi:hypothetical protein
MGEGAAWEAEPGHMSSQVCCLRAAFANGWAVQHTCQSRAGPAARCLVALRCIYYRPCSAHCNALEHTCLKILYACPS